MSNENLAAANNSGKGSGIKVPDSVTNHFNWGAFLLTWIWGLGNKTYITFVIFASLIAGLIPFVGFLVPLGLSIWFGIKGNEWAWQNKHFDSVESFHEYQKKWALWGIIVFVVGFVIGIFGAAAMIAGMATAFSSSVQ